MSAVDTIFHYWPAIAAAVVAALIPRGEGRARERAGLAAVGAMMALRGTYATIMIGLFGPQQGPVADAGFQVIAARDAAEFAQLWDGIWS